MAFNAAGVENQLASGLALGKKETAPLLAYRQRGGYGLLGGHRPLKSFRSVSTASAILPATTVWFKITSQGRLLTALAALTTAATRKAMGAPFCG
jgi:hypothetical protein